MKLSIEVENLKKSRISEAKKYNWHEKFTRRFKVRIEQTEEWVSKLEDRRMEITEWEKQEKDWRDMNRD